MKRRLLKKILRVLKKIERNVRPRPVQVAVPRDVTSKVE